MANQNFNLDRLIQNSENDWERVVEALVNNYYSDLCYLAKTILHDPDDAEDVAQETLIIAVNKLHQYRPGTNLKAWLYTITVNTSRRFYRKRKIRQNLVDTLQDTFSRKDQPVSPERVFLQYETETQLWQAVNTLNDRHRLPIILRYLHGLPCREIAEVLEINEGTVRSRLHNGVRKLQGILERDGFSARKDWRLSG